VDFVDVDQDKAQALHLGQARGAEITILDHDAPAGKAGLRQHDVIVEFNGKAIENADALKLALHHTPIGRKVQLVVSRDGVRITVNTQMADRRKMQEEARKEIDGGSSSGLGKGFLAGGSTDSSSSGGFHILGMGNSLKVGALVEPLSPQMADFLGVTSGLMIKSVAHKSAAYAAGLEPHDVILAVGGETVLSSSDWERLLRASEGKPVQVEILRDRTKQLVLLSVDGMRH
jgi:S1-C subfamily serine protease